MTSEERAAEMYHQLVAAGCDAVEAAWEAVEHYELTANGQWEIGELPKGEGDE